MRGQEGRAPRGRRPGDPGCRKPAYDSERPAHGTETGDVVRRSQQSRGSVVWMIEARTVVVGVVVGMSGTVSDGMPVDDLVIVIGVHVRGWQNANQRHCQGGDARHGAHHPNRQHCRQYAVAVPGMSNHAGRCPRADLSSEPVAESDEADVRRITRREIGPKVEQPVAPLE